MSNKRRRCINVSKEFVELLKGAASKLEKTTPTKLATLILTGEHAPLGRRESMSGTHGVSMTEALWLSIKDRAHASDKSTVEVTEEILIGTAKPLTPEEIKHGKERAAEREAKRAESAPEEKTVPKAAKSKAKTRKQSIDQASLVKAQREHEKEERERQRMKLHKGQLYEQKTDRTPNRLEPGEEFYSGVKYI